MISRDHLRRLHFINALFAGLTGDDLYLAEQIQAAITASLAERDRPASTSGGTGESAFTAAATRLLARLGEGRPDRGFFHWDAADATAAGPLFAREMVLEGLRRLAPYRESTLLVTNLRPAHCPPRRRWTDRRRREYRESLALIRDLAATHSRRSASVNLLFL